MSLETRGAAQPTFVANLSQSMKRGITRGSRLITRGETCKCFARRFGSCPDTLSIEKVDSLPADEKVLRQLLSIHSSQAPFAFDSRLIFSFPIVSAGRSRPG
jgi:hypothetical protein